MCRPVLRCWETGSSWFSYYRDSMRIDLATTGGAGGTDLFTQNAFQLRAEVPVAVAIQRPQALCTAFLTSGS
jgi:hypothetical protein